MILSNGTDSLALVRGPFDVANMSILFGMKSGLGNKLVSGGFCGIKDHLRETFSDNCCKLLLRSQARRTIKGALHIAPVHEAPAPAFIKREDHLAALSAIPEFQEQMQRKPRLEISETS
jgi:hypothetical protein